MPDKVINLTVTHCPRCGEDHLQVAFSKFQQQPVPGYTHWGMCSTLYEPILKEVLESQTRSRG